MKTGVIILGFVLVSLITKGQEQGSEMIYLSNKHFIILSLMYQPDFL